MLTSLLLMAQCNYNLIQFASFNMRLSQFSLNSRKELLFLYDELSADYRNLLTAANVLQMLTDKSVVIAGDSKQRPISYYIDEGCRILYIWNIYQKSSEKLLANIDIRNNESVKEFSKFIESPTDLTHKLEDYLLYCTFILAAK